MRFRSKNMMLTLLVLVMLLGSWQPGHAYSQEDRSTEISRRLGSGNDPSARFGSVHPLAPQEVEQFGQLVGKWKCRTFALTDSGDWQEREATWTWFYILDGFAVQDIWHAKTVPFMNRPLYGTNIRAFDADAKKWQIIWIENGSNKFDKPYEGVLEAGNIVVTGATRDGTKFRVTFFNITRDSFDWKSEDLQPDGETWKETFRIRAKREE